MSQSSPGEVTASQLASCDFWSVVIMTNRTIRRGNLFSGVASFVDSAEAAQMLCDPESEIIWGYGHHEFKGGPVNTIKIVS